MTEVPSNQEWIGFMRSGIEEAFDNYDLFGRVINFSPIVLSDSRDERDWRDLSNEERRILAELVFDILGVDKENMYQVAQYTFNPPKPVPGVKPPSWSGTASVTVYKTKRSSEGMYLHEINRPSTETEYVVADKDYRY
jgi:hypothetical protein